MSQFFNESFSQVRITPLNSLFTGMTVSQGRFNGLIFITSMNIIYFLSIARPKLAQFRIDQEIHFSSSPFAFDEVLE